MILTHIWMAKGESKIGARGEYLWGKLCSVLVQTHVNFYREMDLKKLRGKHNEVRGLRDST